jgi:hypothetical protein
VTAKDRRNAPAWSECGRRAEHSKEREEAQQKRQTQFLTISHDNRLTSAEELEGV